MKTMKKLLTAALATALLVSALAIPANAATSMKEWDAETREAQMKSAWEWMQAQAKACQERLDKEAAERAAAEAANDETPAAQDGTYFADVPADASYADAVNALAQAGIITSDDSGNFRPNDTVTYGEFVTILARIANLPTEATENEGDGWGAPSNNCYGNRIVGLGYTQKPHWAAWAVYVLANRAYDKKMIVNIEDLDCNVVRGHALAVIYRIMQYVGLDTTPVNNYTEADIPDWNDVLGVDNHWGRNVYYIDDQLHFLPDEFIYGWDDANHPVGYNLADKNTYGSVEYTNPDMKPYVYAKPDRVLAMYNLGITEGVDADHNCAPLRTMTRAELCVLLQRAGLDHVFSK